MNETLLCLNAEWQGCESTILETGAKKLARQLFGQHLYRDISTSDVSAPEIKDDVFALETISRQFKKTMRLLHQESPRQILTVGGSCGVDAAPVSYLNNLYQGDMGVIWFDAHGDLNTPTSSPSGHFHGMVLRTLLGEGPQAFCDAIPRPLLPSQVFLAGVRDLDAGEKQYIKESGISMCEVENSLAETILKRGFQKVYVHIDVDVLNPDSFSDALMPVEGGPTLDQISQCLFFISQRLNIVGLSIVEYCGKHEESENRLIEMLERGGAIHDSGFL